jgi:hypothetical protein
VFRMKRVRVHRFTVSSWSDPRHGPSGVCGRERR